MAIIFCFAVIVLFQIHLNMRAASSSSSFSTTATSHLSSLQPPNQLNQDRIHLYNPSIHPVLTTTDPKKIPIKTGIVSISPLIGEAMHYIYDGVIRSNLLSLVGVVSLYGENNTDAMTIIPKGIKFPLQPQDADLWIVDGARVAKLNRSFLDQLIHSNETSWRVLFVDFTDRFQFQLRNYQKLDIWDQKHIRLAVRSIVQGRNYDSKTNTIVSGKIAPNHATAGGPMLHSPYAVRTDIIETIQQVLRISTNTSSALADAIFDPNRTRPIDVVHPWNVSFKEGKSKLRNAVSQLVRSWNGTLRVANHILTSSIDEHGERRHVGRNMVDPVYVRALLSAKIVIVTQRDDWEDHYRLFESLSCGALILHDSMVAPPKGFVDGETIVFFKSLRQLEERVLYYLEEDRQRKAIAKRGWELAMGRHRSWHRMEELIFGRPLTSVIVNADAS